MRWSVCLLFLALGCAIGDVGDPSTPSDPARAADPDETERAVPEPGLPSTEGGAGSAGGRIEPYPGVVPVELSRITADAIRVAPDGRHVAALRVRLWGDSFCAGDTADVALYSVTPAGVATRRDLEPSVSVALLAFAGERLVYVAGAASPCRRAGTLRVALPDGTHRRTLAERVDDLWVGREGAVFHREDGSLAAIGYGGGAPLELTPRGGASPPTVVVDPRGRTAAILEDGVLRLVALGATPQVVGAGRATSVRWALGGDRLVIQTPEGGVATVDRDGASRAVLAETCMCTTMSLEAGGARLAIDVWNRRTIKVEVQLFDLRSGATATVRGRDLVPQTAGAWGRIELSPDGRWLAVATFPTAGRTSGLWVAPAIDGAEVQIVAADIDVARWQIAPSSDAIIAHRDQPDRTLRIPLPAGPRVAEIDETGPFAAFEPGVPEPRVLLLDGWRTGVIGLRVVGPGGDQVWLPARLDAAVAPARQVWWAGGEVAYLTDERDCGAACRAHDFAAATPDGTRAGVLGTRVVDVAWADGGAWAYFVRSAASGGGLWRVELPRP